MGLKYNIKKKLMLASIRQRNKDNPFDLVRYENYQLPSDATPYDINSHYFSGHTLDGESLIIRMSFRGQGLREIWFVYHDKNNTYSNRKTSYVDEEVPLKIELVEAGKKWHFSFKGQLTRMEIDDAKLATFTGEDVIVEAEGDFTSETPMFDFNTHLDPELLASALAREKWDQRFKHDMKLNQQVHLEQQGFLNANLTINTHVIKFSSNAMRDHSFGRRDWNYVNRHIWLLAVIRKGEILNLNRISYPYLKHLITGYYEKDGRVEQISLANNTASIPTLGSVPEKFKYHVELRNAIRFDVKAEVEVIIPFIFNEGKYVIYEGIGTFDVNKRKARGVLEFGFHADKSRWQISE